MGSSYGVKRPKVFGDAPQQALSRDEKAKIVFVALARSKKQAKKGNLTGPITRAAEKVLRALLYAFGGKTGRRYPSYDAIASEANVDRSTVARAIVVLEAEGVLTWINRITKQRVGPVNLTRRTSNGYVFHVPGSKSHPAMGDQSFKISSKASFEIRPDRWHRKPKEAAHHEAIDATTLANALKMWPESEMVRSMAMAAARRIARGLA